MFATQKKRAIGSFFGLIWDKLKSIIEIGTATAEARRNANSIPPQDVKNSVDYSTSHEVEFKKKFKPK